MPSEIERIAVLEEKATGIQEAVSRLRNHVSELLTFRANLEGGMKTLKIMLGFIGLSNIALLIKILAFSK